MSSIRLSSSDWWREPRVVIAAAALVTSLLGFGWTLGGYFVGDDFGYVERFYRYPLAEWPRLLRESWAGDIWGFQLRELRPVTALSFILESRLWGGNATGYRVTNLLLHAGCATLVGWLAWRAAGRQLACGLVAAVLFALHPAHAEPVQWITGRVDVLTTFFYLAGFAAFVRYRETGDGRWLVGFAGLYAAAALAKEFGLTLPVMCFFADVLWRRGERRWGAWSTWAPYAIAAVIATAYAFCRRAAFGADGAGAAWPDLTSGAFYAQLAQRQLTYLGHLFPPAERWWFEGAPLLAQRALRTWLIVMAVVAAGYGLWWWAARRSGNELRRAAVFFGLGWYLVATLPLVVTYISARHLYLASAGVCVALALLLQGVLRWRSALIGIAVVVGVLFVQKLRVTMQPWHYTAKLSGRLMVALRELEPQLVPGGALLLDVPEIHEGAYVWTWGVPFVLRPPFLRERWDDRVLALESRGLYFDTERWHEQPAFAKLADITQPSWILHGYDPKGPRRIAVPVERIRPAAERFLKLPLKEQPHESWRKLIDDLAPPRS